MDASRFASTLESLRQSRPESLTHALDSFCGLVRSELSGSPDTPQGTVTPTRINGIEHYKEKVWYEIHLCGCRLPVETFVRNVRSMSSCSSTLITGVTSYTFGSNAQQDKARVLSAALGSDSLQKPASHQQPPTPFS